MESLEAELDRARDLSVSALADAVEEIGFECTRCGACCKSEAEDPHTATVFPDEVRTIRDAGDERDWRDVARPMPFGLREARDGDSEGETFEWALQTDDCGDCTFYREDDGVGACTVHDARPLICRTYPFSVVLADDAADGSEDGNADDSAGATAQPMGDVVDASGPVRAHECEGLGRDIARADAEEMARALKERAVRELEEAIAVRDRYRPADPGPGEVVVHDSEGAKAPDGTPLGREE